MIDRVALSRIRETLDLPALIGNTRRVGNEYLARCPFHDDRKPSLTIYRDAGVWFFKCFPCGAHGDGIDFVARTHGLSFIDAIGRASEITGIELRDIRRMSPEERTQAKAEAESRDFAYRTTRGLDATLSQWATTAALRAHHADQDVWHWQRLYNLATVDRGEDHCLTKIAGETLAKCCDEQTKWAYRFAVLQEAASHSATWEEKMAVYLEFCER